MQLNNVARAAPDFEFGSILAGDVMRDGTAVVVDHRAPGVVAIGPGGEVAWEAIGSGDGPGEFRMPYRVAVGPGDSVFVYDQQARRITVFSRTGEYANDRRISFQLSQVDGFLVGPDHVIFSGVTLLGEDASVHGIHVFDRDLNHQRSFGPLPETENPEVLRYWGAGAVRWGGDGSILYVRRHPYEVYTYTVEGELLGQFAAPFTWDLGPADAIQIEESAGSRTISRADVNVPLLMPATRLSRSGFILSGRLLGDVSYFDLFTEEGALVSSSEIPEHWKGVIGVAPEQRLIWIFGSSRLEPAVYRATYTVTSQR